MPSILTYEVTGYLLVFARIGAIIMLLPGIGDDGVPPRVRLLFAILLSLIVYPAVILHLPPMPSAAPALLGLLIAEVAIGLMIGAIVRVLFASLSVAGTVIATQSGLAGAMTFDPLAGAQNPLVARFMGVTGVVLIFASGLHHVILSGAVRSYMLFNPGDGLIAGDFAKLATDAVQASFALGLQLAAPFLVYGIIFNVGLGLIARLTPSIQVFFIAQPLNILLAFALLLATIGLTMTVFVERFAEALRLLLG